MKDHCVFSSVTDPLNDYTIMKVIRHEGGMSSKINFKLDKQMINYSEVNYDSIENVHKAMLTLTEAVNCGWIKIE